MSNKTSIGIITVIALVGIGVYLFFKYKKIKEIQNPLPQEYDPVQPQQTNTPFNPVTYTSVAGVNPFLAGNL
jgi:flagellar basal body-associated protein FliL